MWYSMIKKNSYPLKVYGKTVDSFVKNKYKFKVEQGTVVRWKENGLL